MAHLSLTTVSGNSVIRHFPFQGYLGLTPVHIEGIVQIRLEAKQKRIPAKLLTVSVRAYESRRTGNSQTRVLVDYSQTLWSKPSDQPHAELGDFQSPFKITLPKGVVGFSTVNYQDYRTYWRVEATLEHAVAFKSDIVLSKHFDLLLTRHDISRPLSPPPLPSGPDIDPALPLRTDKPRAPVLHYNISTPVHAVGPTDLLFTSVFIRPVDKSVKLRSASLLVERRLVLHDDRPSSPLSANRFRAHISLRPSPAEHGSADDVFAFGVVRSPSSPVVATPSNIYPSPPTSREGTGRQKTVTSTVAVGQAAAFSLDRETGVWTKTISLPWPASKGQSRWPIGETVRGALGSVSFWVKVKVAPMMPATPALLIACRL
ncbi:uncharacterized protein PHACADRAFT_101605 [Phanerochaete carnosa HHB-10118-sp]|uniref:Arrestin-like N-terminal domain-containing protein n=1 Tax=Phanerochaete carnosa (strain HHB-10118-sp) TaxID=650164 RepID=K5VZ83_PHACS|nr:uncharacterized protein PHACADRAFT_101605 [Phanerochaete carnosa HHB-10118-sp]EKM51909.1 hypothetical protein PHACADRAFT_101605 [Phanerochaete carnosa HHB-10118-sp]